jgi:hypothetical protein
MLNRSTPSLATMIPKHGLFSSWRALALLETLRIRTTLFQWHLSRVLSPLDASRAPLRRVARRISATLHACAMRPAFGCPASIVQCRVGPSLFDNGDAATRFSRNTRRLCQFTFPCRRKNRVDSIRDKNLGSKVGSRYTRMRHDHPILEDLLPSVSCWED